MSKEKHQYEGWIPSAETLRDLLEIAPREWAERLASLAVREGMFAETPTWGPGYGGGASERIAKARGFILSSGPAGLPLLWRQLIEDDATTPYGIDVTLQPSAEGASHAEAFLNGLTEAVISAPGVGIQRKVGVKELTNTLEEMRRQEEEEQDNWPVSLSLFPDSAGPKSWAEAVVQYWATNDWSTSDNRFEEALDRVYMAAERILQNDGYLRGPCNLCGRMKWLVPDLRPSGKRPLVHAQCPVCSVALTRQRKAEWARRARATPKKSEHDE